MSAAERQHHHRNASADLPEFNHSTYCYIKSSYANRGSAFSKEQREMWGLTGLLPERVETLEQQVARVRRQFDRLTHPLQKYIFLSNLQDTNTTLFYATCQEFVTEILPIIYTPTVGRACQEFDEIWSSTRGMYFSPNSKGNMRKILDNWPCKVEVIVITDGSRILGLGDLGANGMGISKGKISLYTVGGGLDPRFTVPMVMDVGTGNQQLLTNEGYLGLRQDRIGDEEFYALFDEYMAAVKDKWPKALVQFEDFSNNHCFDLLDRYRESHLCFNDDIQGTGAVVLSGFINACKASGIPAKDQRIVFFGAGSAGTGVADNIVAYMVNMCDMTEEQARHCFYFVDSKGLVTNNRGDTLAKHKVVYARKDMQQQLSTLMEVVEFVKPTCLMGLSGQGGTFTEQVLRYTAEHCKRPYVCALSNPTSKAECSMEDAIRFTDGRALFSSGSPFPPTEYNGVIHEPNQANNMYIFPGLGLGAVTSESVKIPDSFLLAAALTLANLVPEERLHSPQGILYPGLQDIQDISARIASAVVQQSVKEGLARAEGIPSDDAALLQWVKGKMWRPRYDYDACPGTF